METDEQIIQRHVPSVRERARIELVIVHETIKKLMEAGYTCFIDDGEADFHSSNEQELVSAIFSVEDCYLYAEKDGKQQWVRLVMGNDGWDVINNYTVPLSPIIDPIVGAHCPD